MTRLAVPLALSPHAFAGIDPAAAVVDLSGATMGTTWGVRLVAPPQYDDAGTNAAIEAVLAGIVAEMSNWEATSALSRFNSAPALGWHPLSGDFLTVLEAALLVAEQSDGAFDPTAGALVDLWGFGPPGPRVSLPADEEIEVARACTGWRRIGIDPAKRRAFQPGGVALDLCGIAKGFAVDRVAETLLARGVRHCLVEIGGELRGHGVRPDCDPWWVALEAPPGSALPETRIALHELSVATSGDYRRFMDANGRRLSHSLDPRSGHPVANGVVSVSVVHPSCMMADAYATAITVLGAEEGLALAARLDFAVLIVAEEEGGLRELISPALAAMLE